jgi:hypothetical protein
MALTIATLETLRSVIASLPNRPLRMITAGYPDIVILREHLEKMFGAEFVAALQVRPDSDSIIRWHGVDGKIDAVYETRHFFSLLGVEVAFLDIAKVRGDEIIQDLNGPLHPELEQKFDIVLDGGTMEHCFNVAQTIRNYLSMAKVGGYIVHSNPFNMPNHGFYNFSPTFYADFYEDNGHKITRDIVAVSNKVFDPELAVLHKTARFRSSLPEAYVMVVAQKQNDRPPIWPMQTKYKGNPGLAN